MRFIFSSLAARLPSLIQNSSLQNCAFLEKLGPKSQDLFRIHREHLNRDSVNGCSTQNTIRSILLLSYNMVDLKR
jgi:hypothetical protein